MNIFSSGPTSRTRLVQLKLQTTITIFNDKSNFGLVFENSKTMDERLVVTGVRWLLMMVARSIGSKSLGIALISNDEYKCGGNHIL